MVPTRGPEARVIFQTFVVMPLLFHLSQKHWDSKKKIYSQVLNKVGSVFLSQCFITGETRVFLSLIREWLT